MPLTLAKETMDMNWKDAAASGSSQILLEGDMIVPDSKPDLQEILRCQGNVKIREKRVTDDRISFSGDLEISVLYRAKNGEYVLMEMKNRSKMQDPAEVYTVDMRKELKNGNRSILSEQLQRLMKERLEKKEQTMLFLNRRGYSGFVSCRECGHVIKCPHCDVSLSVHRDGKMRCHYCGYEQTHVKICPECGSDHIGEFRAGTQQIEEIVKTVFPQARVLRMDMDTTRQKDSHEKILSAFANEEADVLVGTQMIVKGHDFPNVTLVGILAADMSLYTDDYRSGERTFQLFRRSEERGAEIKKEKR